MSAVGSEMVETTVQGVLYISHSRFYHMAAPFPKYLPFSRDMVLLNEALCALPKNTLVDSRTGKFSTSNKAIRSSTVMISLHVSQHIHTLTRSPLPS